MERIGTAVEAHGVNSPDEYRARALDFLREKRAAGFPVEVNILKWREPQIAHINHGRWVTFCPVCHSAPACHPEWLIAICFACGIELDIVMPDDWRLGEQLLMQRENYTLRDWRTERGEPLENLVKENVAMGIAVAYGEVTPEVDALARGMNRRPRRRR